MKTNVGNSNRKHFASVKEYLDKSPTKGRSFHDMMKKDFKQESLANNTEKTTEYEGSGNISHDFLDFLMVESEEQNNDEDNMDM